MEQNYESWKPGDILETLDNIYFKKHAVPIGSLVKLLEPSRVEKYSFITVEDIVTKQWYVGWFAEHYRFHSRGIVEAGNAQLSFDF